MSHRSVIPLKSFLRNKETRQLLEELHYWQMRVRLDIRSLERSKAKCKEIAARLRARRAFVESCLHCR